MQYSVPQFTDVEDKIIGGLTLKQFGIMLLAGGVVFGIYSGTKNIPVSVAALLIFGLPALGIAFGKFNGRPFYNILPVFFNFLVKPKFLVFHKETRAASESVKLRQLKALEAQSPNTQQGVKMGSQVSRLKELNYALEAQAKREEGILEQTQQQTRS